MSCLDDDGFPSSDFIAYEEPDSSGHRQALWVGVRKVWYGPDVSDKPMVQVCYQDEYMGSSLQGPVFLTPDTWDNLCAAVRWRLDKEKPWWKRHLFRWCS